MKIKCIACDALARPVYWCAAQSPHNVDVEVVRFGLHSEPNKLRNLLQEKINAISGFDYVALVYGLCGQATAGLKAGGIPLVMPRCHDCITLFLGSRERYDDQFTNYPGTYWYSQDYIERADGSNTSLAIGSGMDNGSGIQGTYEEYVQKYGEDNAQYLMEVMGAWQQHYKRAAYIHMEIGDGGASNSAAVEAKAQQEAARRGWSFERIAGDLTLIRRLLFGEWDEKDFLTIQPGQMVQMSYDEAVIKVA